MLARLTRELPSGEYFYEPKWDGFRCIAFCSGDSVDLRSRSDRHLSRYFPELVDALRPLAAAGAVLDGEIVAADEFDFDALMLRLHPARSRVERLALENPAAFVAFDLLALGAEDLCERPFAERRARLAELIGDGTPGLRLTPATEDEDVAHDWLGYFTGGGIDGVIAKARDLPYEPGTRRMLKVKQERTADCVVAGFRSFVAGPAIGSLLLGLYDEAGRLEHVGVVASFKRETRRQVEAELLPRIVPLAGHPWEHGFLLGGGAGGRLAGAASRWSPEDADPNWIPVEPVLVCEVAYDQVDRRRFRHAARFRRWRPDRDPRSCTFTQLDHAAPRVANVAVGG